VGGTMDAVRARLAPIRGIPTKQGNLADPNQVLRRLRSCDIERSGRLICRQERRPSAASPPSRATRAAVLRGLSS